MSTKAQTLANRRLGRRIILNLGHLDFDIVSDFDIRISDFASLGPLHLSRTLYKSALFMQNKPNLVRRRRIANERNFFFNKGL